MGDWKLVRPGRKGPRELYNLKADRTELHDLAAAEPERARQFAAKWAAWARRTHAIPYPTGAQNDNPGDVQRKAKAGRNAKPRPADGSA